MQFNANSSLCINTIRVLAADMVEKAKSGHPGAPMGLAPLAHVLFSQHMRLSPSLSKNWLGRDRFVLSNGHACALQYVMLHLLGFKVSLEDLKSFRQLDSCTPGHPECFLTDGVEVSTGPLGQGISNAVGLAIAQAHIASTFNKPGFEELFSNYTFCIVGDGCLQEGIASEALSLAGHLRLNKLIVMYDDNHIQIDGDTEMAFTEDVLKRMESYGFDVQNIDNGDYDLEAIHQALERAKDPSQTKPSFIKIRTTIGLGSASQGTERVHGAPLGAEQLKNVKKHFGFEEQGHFVVPQDVSIFYSQVKERMERQVSVWNAMYQAYSKAHPDLAAEIQRRINNELPKGWKDTLPRFTPADPHMATRKMSELVLNKLAPIVPELVGGSADLTGSNLTRWKGAVDFQDPKLAERVKAEQKSESKVQVLREGMELIESASYSGRYIRFGVREHAMFAICNGISAYHKGLLIPFSATFLNFITYGFGSVRLSALSHHHVIYIMTHDSIGLGEDGPTHQPIETLAALRALPNLLVLRPADGNEVSGSYSAALVNRTRPSVLCLSRQNVPNLQGTSVESVALGAYTVSETIPNSKPDIVIAATGSEVSLAAEAIALLKGKNPELNVRLVSMPSWELFSDQPFPYQRSVFPSGVPVLSVEALSIFGWSKYAHAHVGMQTFGASAPYKELYNKFGFTSSNISEKALSLIEYYHSIGCPPHDLISLNEFSMNKR
jgi:transketolase